jgi:hypothetical protein
VLVEPVPDEPAATATLDGETALVVADYHAGIERALQRDGIEVRSRASRRRHRVLDLLDRVDADRVVFLGDLGHDIGEAMGVERDELERLVDAIPVPITLVKGNHDGKLQDVLDVEVTPSQGTRRGGVGFVHGHTWPGEAALSASILCVGHEHPTVRLEDEVGGSRVERAWLRGSVDPTPFAAHRDDAGPVPDELVVFPAFNDLVGGTWVNVEGQAFLSPFLPDASPHADAYLLDGTRLGPYDDL